MFTLYAYPFYVGYHCCFMAAKLNKFKIFYTVFSSLFLTPRKKLFLIWCSQSQKKKKGNIFMSLLTMFPLLFFLFENVILWNPPSTLKYLYFTQHRETTLLSMELCRCTWRVGGPMGHQEMDPTLHL